MNAVSRRNLGPLSEVRQTQLFEGDKAIIRRPDGSTETTKFNTIRTEFFIENDELPNLSLEDILQRIDNAAREMGQKQLATTLKDLFESLERAGQTVAGPPTTETVFSMLENMEIEFNSDGTPSQKALLYHPSLAETFKQIITEIEENLELQKRMNDLMRRKREDYYARQASRQLVG